MSLYQNNKTVYLTIKNGKIEGRDPQTGQLTTYSGITAHLKRLTQAERDFHGEKVPYHYVEMWDDENPGVTYSFGFGWSNGVWKSIVLSLAAAPNLTRHSTVTITPYLKDGYQKVTVDVDGERLRWVTQELPPVEVRRFGNREVKDDSLRMAAVIRYRDIVNLRLNNSQPGEKGGEL